MPWHDSLTPSHFLAVRDSTSTSSDDSINKNSAFKKAMGHTNGNSAWDANNNDRHGTGKTTTVEIMANPFTSVNVPDSPTYEDPRSTLLLTSTSSPLTRTRDPSPYASPVTSSPPIHEGPDSNSEGRDEVNALQEQQGGLRRVTPGRWRFRTEHSSTKHRRRGFWVDGFQ